MRKHVVIILAALAFMSACSNSNDDSSAVSTPTSTPEIISDTSSEAPETSSGETGYSSDTLPNTAETSEISSTDTENSQDEISDNKEENTMNIEITVNGQTFSAELYDNETARAFKERLPLTLDMNELNGN